MAAQPLNRLLIKATGVISEFDTQRVMRTDLRGQGIMRPLDGADTSNSDLLAHRLGVRHLQRIVLKDKGGLEQGSPRGGVAGDLKGGRRVLALGS